MSVVTFISFKYDDTIIYWYHLYSSPQDSGIVAFIINTAPVLAHTFHHTHFIIHISFSCKNVYKSKSV